MAAPHPQQTDAERRARRRDAVARIERDQHVIAMAQELRHPDRDRHAELAHDLEAFHRGDDPLFGYPRR